MNRPRPSGEPRTRARRSPRPQARERAPEPGRAAAIRLTHEIEDAAFVDEWERMIRARPKPVRGFADDRGWGHPPSSRFA